MRGRAFDLAVAIKRRTIYHLHEAILNAAPSEMVTEDQEAHRVQVSTLEEANLVGSKAEHQFSAEMHWPVIDIDVPIAAVPSKTEGHYHLYIEKAISWPHYMLLLTVMAQAGIVEWGYLNASIARGQTFVRLPKEEGGEETQ